MYCKRCRSTKVVKNGCMTRWRAGRKYKVQNYLCNACGRQMTVRIGG